MLLVGVKSHGAENVPPILRINDPFAAPIWRINVDADERYLVAGSADKAVTVWTLNDWKKPAIHRVPPRPEEDQRAHPTAISPDGAIVAYGVPPLRDSNGWPVPGTSKIYILDTDTGKILKEIGDIAKIFQNFAHRILQAASCFTLLHSHHFYFILTEKSMA